MAEVLLFGATGYTGRLTAHALARRSAHFAICGRDRDKLQALSNETGHPEVRTARVGDVDSVVRALEGARVLISCVGPFVEMGDTAAEAAVRAGCHYVDSTGEGAFIDRLYDHYDDRARAAGITMAPSFGFDEVPSDVAATIAAGDMEDAELVLTYAVPTTGSVGTMKSALGIMTGTGNWVADGRVRTVRAGEETRWAPMPPPLGPRASVAMPLAIGHIAPRHLDLRSLKVFTTVGRAQRMALKPAVTALRAVWALPLARTGIRSLLGLLPEGPGETGRTARWTVLAEARSGRRWRNVTLTGRDVYGLTGELLAAGALIMASEDYDNVGVSTPVEAAGLETLEKVLAEQGVETVIHEPTGR